MRALLSALSFLTRIPLPGFLHTRIEGDRAADAFSRSVYWFPAVGLILGLLLAGADILLGRIFPAQLAAGLLLVFYVFLTGGLHLDGLLDSADGLFSGRDSDRIPEIMRDSSAGAFAVLTAVLYLLLKFLCFWLLTPAWRPGAFILMAVFSRLINSLGLLYFPILSRSLAGVFADDITFRRSAILIFPPLLSVIFLLYFNMFPIYVILIAGALMSAFTLVVARIVENMLGGLTGDIFGMFHELNELIFLLVIIALQ